MPDIATGPARSTTISGMNWYSRAERHGIRVLGRQRAPSALSTLYDTVYNLNMAHLSHEVGTIFDVGDAKCGRPAPFLIYRGRRRHELGLEGLMRRVAVAADFRHAVGPDEVATVGCMLEGPLQADPAAEHAHNRVRRQELIADDAYDFLFSPPTTTTTPTSGVGGQLDRSRDHSSANRGRGRGRRTHS